jgi:hypothetical protein
MYTYDCNSSLISDGECAKPTLNTSTFSLDSSSLTLVRFRLVWDHLPVNVALIVQLRNDVSRELISPLNRTNTSCLKQDTFIKILYFCFPITSFSGGPRASGLLDLLFKCSFLFS